MKVVAYLRVSTDRQAEEGLGLEVQEAAIRTWAAAQGAEIVTVYKDEGISGSNGIETRIGLADAIEALRTTDAEGLVVYRLDRLARDLVLQEQLLAEVKRIGAQVFSTSKAEAGYLQDDPADPSRKLIRQVLGAVSEYERAMISLRLRSGRARKAENGGFAYGSPPFGYRAEKKALVPVPHEQAVIAEIVSLRSQGMSYERIPDELNDRGVKPPRSGLWHGPRIRAIVRRADKDAQNAKESVSA